MRWPTGFAALVLVANSVVTAGPPKPVPPEPLARWGDTRFRHPAEVNSLALRPDGKILATTTSRDPLIWLWDTATGHEVRRITLPATESKSPAHLIGFTPDGRRLVSEWGRDIRVYDPETGQEVAAVAGGAEKSQVTLGPDGLSFAGINDSGRLILWAVESGRQVRDLGAVPGGDRGGICFSPDGKRAAVFRPRGWNNAVIAVTSADGSKPAEVVYTGGIAHWRDGFHWPRADRLITVWPEAVIAIDPDTGKEVARRPRVDGNERLVSVHLTATGQLYAKVAPGADVIELDLGTLARKPKQGITADGGPAPVVTTPDGKTLAVARYQSVRVHDHTGKSRFHGLDEQPAATPQTIGFSADGRRVVTAGPDAIRVWNAATGAYLSAAAPADGLTAEGLVSPDGRWVAGVTAGKTGKLVVWDTRTAAVAYHAAAPGGDANGGPAQRADTGLIGFDPGSRLWTFDRRSGRLRQLGFPHAEVIRSIDGYSLTEVAKLSPDGGQIVVSGWNAFAVRSSDRAARWRPLSGYPELGLEIRGDGHFCPHPSGFTPDGRRLVIQTMDGALAVWDVTGGPHRSPYRIVRRPAADGARDATPGCAFTPDGRRILQLVVDGNRPTLRVLETATLREEFRFAPSADWVRYALSPDGRRLVLAHRDTTLTVWDWETVRSGARAAASFPTVPADAVWDQLADADPEVGLAAVYALAANPKAAVPMLRERVRMTPVAALVADLANPAFTTREEAEEELIALGPVAEGALRDVVRSASPEVAFRARRILVKLKPGDRLPPVLLRSVRVVEVLERIGSADAETVLKSWAKTGAGTLLGVEAQAALDRLSKAGR